MHAILYENSHAQSCCGRSFLDSSVQSHAKVNGTGFQCVFLPAFSAKAAEQTKLTSAETGYLSTHVQGADGFSSPATPLRGIRLRSFCASSALLRCRSNEHRTGHAAFCAVSARLSAFWASILPGPRAGPIRLQLSGKSLNFEFWSRTSGIGG